LKVVSLFVQTTVVPGLMVMISGSKELWIISTFFTIPFEAGVAGCCTAGWDTGADGCEEDDDGTEHPPIIAMQTRMMSRKRENFFIKDRIGAGVVIPFLSRTGYRPVHGNRS
jgi:hypothetical protein